MRQHSVFDNSGAAAPVYARPPPSCVWAIPRHRSQGARQPHSPRPSPREPTRKAHPGLNGPPPANSPDGTRRFNPHNRAAAAYYNRPYRQFGRKPVRIAITSLKSAGRFDDGQSWKYNSPTFCVSCSRSSLDTSRAELLVCEIGIDPTESSTIIDTLLRPAAELRLRPRAESHGKRRGL